MAAIRADQRGEQPRHSLSVSVVCDLCCSTLVDSQGIPNWLVDRRSRRACGPSVMAAVLAPPHGWQGLAIPLPRAEFSASKWEPGGTDRKHKLSFRTNETNCTVSGDCSRWAKKPKIAAEEPKSYTPVRTSQHHSKTPTTPSVARSRQDDRFLILTNWSGPADRTGGCRGYSLRPLPHRAEELHSSRPWLQAPATRRTAFVRFALPCFGARVNMHAPALAVRACMSTRAPGGYGGVTW